MQKIQQPIHADYEKWRDTFLYKKLKLAIVVWSFFHAAMEINATIPGVLGKYYRRGAISTLKFFLVSSQQWLMHELCFIGCLILLQLPQTRKYIKIIFVIFCCTLPFYSYLQSIIYVIPYYLGIGKLESQSVQAFASIGDNQDFIFCLKPIPLGVDTRYYHLLFPIIGVLVPVYLRLHLKSQVSVFLFGIIVSVISDPTYNFWKLSQEQQLACSSSLIHSLIYSLLPCAVIDYGIYLYEKTLKTEFQYWWQLRLFLNAVAHDLRNPVLGTILVLENLLTKPSQKLEVDRTVLEDVVTGNKRQLDLIDSMIEAHASEVQGITLHSQAMVLRPLTQSVVTDLSPILNQERASIMNLIPSNLPAIYIDALQLSRVYHNLIINAIKVNRPGLQITLDAWVIEDKLHCIVADNGIGMSPHQATKLFELYARGQNFKESTGLGLGLYICKQIIIAHNGEIGVNSSPGNGASFWFRLPLA